MGKTLFVVSDIHGHYTLLRQALENAGFDDDNDNHLLIGCGDYFDRGNENAEVLRYLDRIRHKMLLRGNHEDMLLKLLHTGRLQSHHYVNGTLRTVEEFFGRYAVDPVDDTLDFSGKTRVVDRLCTFIDDMVDYYETAGHVFVHGWLPAGGTTLQGRRDASAEEWQRARTERWTNHYEGERPLPDKVLVCGHMPVFYAAYLDASRTASCPDIFYTNGLVAIDAGTSDSGKVNVLVLEDEE